MKKILLLAVALVFVLNVNAEAQLWGRGEAHQVKSIADSTSLTTWSTVLEVNGEGKVYRIMFNNDATHDPFLRITMDGYIDSFTVAANEEWTYYVIRSDELNAVGTSANYKGTVFSIADSSDTAVSAMGGANLDYEFTTHFKVEARSEASGLTNTVVIYSEYD